MTYQQIKSFINTYIVQNGVNAITGSQLNTALNELADYKGFDSVVVTTLPAGSDATATVQGMTLVLGIPKGADGRDGIDGQNAVNPFKGWFTTDNIPTTGQEGDYCNVSNTSVTPHTVTIYRWDATQNAFVDTGEVPDTATGETFASSETLQEVAIDNSHLENPTNTADPTKPVLAQAKDVMLLKLSIGANGITEDTIEFAAYQDGNENKNYYVDGTTGGFVAQNASRTQIADVEGYDALKFLGFINFRAISKVGFSVLDSEMQPIEGYHEAYDIDTTLSDYGNKVYSISLPSNAKYFAWTTKMLDASISGTTFLKGYKGKSLSDQINELQEEVEGNSQDLEGLADDIDSVEANVESLEEITEGFSITKVDAEKTVITGWYIKGTDGAVTPLGQTAYCEAVIGEGTSSIQFLGVSLKNTSATNGYSFYDSNNSPLGFHAYDRDAAQDTAYIEKEYSITIPQGAVKFRWTVKMANYDISTTTYLKLCSGTTIKEYIDNAINTPTPAEEQKTLKVVILEIPTQEMTLYVRTKFSDDKDIIVTMRDYPLSNNTSKKADLTFKDYYVGPRTSGDNELMSSSYKVNAYDIGDAFGGAYTLNFGPIYAQHGYRIVRFSNSSNLSAEYVDTLWKDNDNRQFRIGKINSSYIYLIPVVTGPYGYEAPSYNPWNKHQEALSSITCIDEGVVDKPTIQISGKDRYDLQIQKVVERRFLIDGKIVEHGEFTCDSFSVREVISGKKPFGLSNASDWFVDGYIDSLDEMVRWVRTFNFCSHTCTVNQSMSVTYPFQLEHWIGIAPILPMGVTYNGVSYSSTTYIPYVKAASKRQIDTTSHESTNEKSINKNATDLYDIDKIPSRAHTILYDNNSYLCGMAGGYVTDRGAGKDSYRSEYATKGSPNTVVRLQMNDESGLHNKFYPHMIEGEHFEDNELTTEFAKDCTTFYSWFDPNENPEQQVYWYKEDNYYIVMCHCNGVGKKSVKLPSIFEGMSADVVERSDEDSGGLVELLTEVVLDSKLIVKYEGSENVPKYIVLKLK